MKNEHNIDDVNHINIHFLEYEINSEKCEFRGAGISISFCLMIIARSDS